MWHWVELQQTFWNEGALGLFLNDESSLLSSIFLPFFYFDFPIGWNLISTGILQLISWGHKHTHIRLLPGCDYMHESNQKNISLEMFQDPFTLP